jgi:lipoprotein-releasing system ATP-binding protein
MAVIAPALELKNVSRSYPEAGGQLDVFSNVNLKVHAGEIVALVGPSGAGKSSLLHIAGLLEKPTSGEAHIAGRNCSELDDASRTRVRRVGIGFIYQFHHLLAEFDAVENVVIPQLIANVDRTAAKARARDLLTRLGLERRLDHRPGELSGGEQQRVAIARAIANKPLLLLADEPTGNLDPKTAEQVHAEFLRLIVQEGLGALVATHNIELARRMNRVVKLEHGQLVEMA